MNTLLRPAYHALVEENMGLVHTCCHRFVGKGIEYDDLFGAGCLGLCKAAKGFDPHLGYRFSTYAVPLILGEIRRLFRDGGSVKVSRSVKELGLAVHRVLPTLREKLGREPTVQELSGALGTSPEQVSEALCAARPVLSLSGEGEDRRPFEIPVESKEEETCVRQALQQALAHLPDNDRELIRLRYFENKTQTLTAKALGMTQVQVSRRERVLLQQLRAGMI